MLMATEWVTLVRHVRTTTGDQYLCHACKGSWHSQNKAAVTANGLQTARLVRCRVPVDGLTAEVASALGALAPGDKVVRGMVTVPDGKAFAALGREHEAATLVDKHDNTRGRFPHYYLEGVS